MDGTWGSAGLSDSDLNDLQRRVSCTVHVSGRRCDGCGSFLRQENGGKMCAPCGQARHWATWTATSGPRYDRPLTPEVIKSFWAACRNGSPRKCWGWRGAKNRSGYPVFGLHGVMYQARRVSFGIHKGELPQGQFVISQCGERVCCNPEHLMHALSSKKNGGERELRVLARMLRRLGYRLVKHGKN